MQDLYTRQIEYLRISVTDKCNLRCQYCMPEEGIAKKNHFDLLRFEELLRLARCAVAMGVNKIRLTGGEPLVRKNILSFVAGLAEMEGLQDLALTTNATLLANMAKDLKSAGLQRLNISLDSLKPEVYRTITRGGEFREAWGGIMAALENGFEPVKLNMVVMRDINLEEVDDFARLTQKLPLHVRFIELMPIGDSGTAASGGFVPAEEIRARLNTIGRLIPVASPGGNGPARYYQLPGAKGTIGFIEAISNHFCRTCNRLRLTAEGKIRPCLHHRSEIDLRELLRRGGSDEEIIATIRYAITLKPEGHTMDTEGWDQERTMFQLGG